MNGDTTNVRGVASPPVPRLRGRSVLLALFAAVLLAACGGGDGGPDGAGDTDEPDVTATGTGPEQAEPAKAECDSIPTYEYLSRTQPSDPLLAYFTVGEEFGYWEDRCVAFEPVTVEAGESTVRSNLDTNITVSGADRLLQLHIDNPDEVLVGFMNYTPNYHAATLVMPDSELQEMADLEGAKLATFSTAVSFYESVNAELGELGLDLDEGDYEWVEIPQGAPMADSISNGQVDAIVCHDTCQVGVEQLLDTELRALDHSIESYEALPGPFLAMHKGNYEERPDDVVALVTGFLEAWAFVDENLELAAEMHVEKFPELIGTDETAEEAAARVATSLEARHANNQAPEWKEDSKYMYFYQEPFQIYAELHGVPEAERTELIESTFTNEFVEAAYQEADLEGAREDARS